MVTTTEARRPSLFWTLTEGRAVFELGSFGLLNKVMRSLPKGDGHPVLVLPGFLASDRSTRPMRRLLDELGYKTYGWGLGQNIKFDDHREREMILQLERIFDEHNRKISIIGWSLGGVFARELAKLHPEMVRLVISLGSPITHARETSAASKLFAALNGDMTEPEREGRYQRLHEAPPVPTTSIFTKTDGIVHWRGSVQQPGGDTENIVVPASHVGLGVNPLVMVAIADRLAQAEGEWAPFDRTGWREFVFKGTPVDA